jgi:hypothetical protein
MEAVWDGEKSKLPGDVRPGEQAIVKASVTAPPYDGQYYLVWDLVCGDKWASTAANTRGGNTLIVPVNVSGGKLVALDMTKLYDADVISFDSNRKDGDADGTGLTLPAEFLPPMVTTAKTIGDLWPCGMWTTAQGSGLESSRHISFRYPSKLDGVKNAVTCKGQTIGLKGGRYAAVHILVLSTQETSGEFGLVYKAGKKTASVQISAWDIAPRQGEHPGFACLHRHSPDGDLRGQACYLNHYVLQADPGAELSALVLPDRPAVKIIAITLEKAK